MISSNFLTALHFLVALVYCVIVVLTLRKRGFGDTVSHLLVTYLSLAVLWEALLAVQDYIYFYLALPEAAVLHLTYYGLFLLAFNFFLLSQAFLVIHIFCLLLKQHFEFCLHLSIVETDCMKFLWNCDLKTAYFQEKK